MDILKAQRLLLKIQALLDGDNGNTLTRLEKDLMKSYIQQLYEAVTTEDEVAIQPPQPRIEFPPPTSKPEPKPEPKPQPEPQPKIEFTPPPPPEPKPEPKIEFFPPPAPKPEPQPEPKIEFTPPPQPQPEPKIEFTPPPPPEPKPEPKIEFTPPPPPPQPEPKIEFTPPPPPPEPQPEPKIEFTPPPQPEPQPKIEFTPPPPPPPTFPENYGSGLKEDEAMVKLFASPVGDDVSGRFSHVPIPSIESAMGLNERIFTLNELFEGDKALFDATCAQLNSLASYQEARRMLIDGVATRFKWTQPDRIKMAEQFLRIVARRYPRT